MRTFDLALVQHRLADQRLLRRLRPWAVVAGVLAVALALPQVVNADKLMLATLGLGGLGAVLVFLRRPPLGLIVAVLGSIFAGIATPTEAAGIGALGASLLALANGRLSLSVLYEVSRRTTLTTAFIFGIFIGATAFALVMRALGGDEMIAAGLNAIPFGDMGVIITILAFSFIAGFFLDWLEITLIFLPLVGPVVVNDLGHDPIWFVILFSVALQTSFITPPVGFSLFYLKGAAPKEVATKDIYRGIVPFVLIQLSIVALILILPEIVTWLPQLVYD